MYSLWNGKNVTSSGNQKGSPLRPGGRPTYMKKVSILFSDWSFFYANKESKFASLLSPNSIVLIGQVHVSWLVVIKLLWLVRKVQMGY